jgi:amino acid permease
MVQNGRGMVGKGGLFATKSVEELKARINQGGKLKRVLGPTELTSLGIGAIIGTGIFVLTGQAAAMHAGPGIVLSMVLAGVVSGLAALCYAEFASTVPVAGSAYTYGYATLGELAAWIIGWDRSYSPTALPLPRSSICRRWPSPSPPPSFSSSAFRNPPASTPSSSSSKSRW